MRILVLGGSPRHFGGVETFCSRAMQALSDHLPSSKVRHGGTYTAYLSARTLPQLLGGIGGVVRFRLGGRGVVWLQYVNLPDLAYILIARALGLRVMVTPHLGRNWRSQRDPRLRALSRMLLGRAQRIALLAPTQAEEIALPADVPQSAISTFLPAEVLQPVPRADDTGPLRLLHASRLSREKGTFKVIEVAAALRDRGVPFTLEIAGGADEATFVRLRAMIADHDLADSVTLTGLIAPAALMDRLRASDVLVHLSTIDSYPLIMLEALACGMFPIALDLAGARDIVGRFDGLIVNPTADVAETAAFLATADPDALRQRGQAQAGNVRAALGWPTAAAQLAQALQQTAD
ncbi:glycosyltransferase family 4 protein [Croceibacterium ferulae]|uniref:glycosyltransferase family 4 protein n=1 Tax=Croceibacterium ferulae TaxID=1854641 RepID=UPI000EAE9FE6|nr:glycosyltransferase [Croceibacterium ferulae]